MKCHICENETDFTCDGCEEPVCEDCCVQMTIHNQIDYPLCTICGDFRESERARYYIEREREEARIKAEREAALKKRRETARRNYWKPENVEKRAERKRQRVEFKRKQLEETLKIVSSIFTKG